MGWFCGIEYFIVGGVFLGSFAPSSDALKFGYPCGLTASNVRSAAFPQLPRKSKPILRFFVFKLGWWRDAPRLYGPHKSIYNRFIRWSRLGVRPVSPSGS